MDFVVVLLSFAVVALRDRQWVGFFLVDRTQHCRGVRMFSVYFLVLQTSEVIVWNSVFVSASVLSF